MSQKSCFIVTIYPIQCEIILGHVVTKGQRVFEKLSFYFQWLEIAHYDT